MIKTEERTRTAGTRVAVVELTEAYSCRQCTDLRRCLLKKQTITLCLTDFYFQRSVCKQKSSKVTAVVLNPHFRRMLTVISRRIN